MECVPVLSVAGKEAIPVRRGRVVVWVDTPLLSLNVTVPVGTALPPFVTVAWNVKLVPNVAVGLAELPGLSTVVVGVALIVIKSELLLEARLLESAG
jgi:hypothetical protein